MRKQAASRYAEALFLKADKPESFLKEMLSLMKVLRGYPAFIDYLAGPASSQEKEKSVRNALKRASSLLIDFFLLLIRKGRVKEYEAVCDLFEKKCQEKEGVVGATLMIASPSLQGASQGWQPFLKAAYGKEARIKEEIDPSLIGGMVLKVGDKQIDGSLKRRLIHLKRALKS